MLIALLITQGPLLSRLWLAASSAERCDWPTALGLDQWEPGNGIDCVMMRARPVTMMVLLYPMMRCPSPAQSCSRHHHATSLGSQYPDHLLAHRALVPSWYLTREDLSLTAPDHLIVLTKWLMMHGASVTSSGDSSVKTEASLLHRAGVTPLNFSHQASAAAAGLYSDKLGEEEHLYNSLGE